MRRVVQALVVGLIVFIGVGLLAKGLAGLRDSYLKGQCSNHLRDIGLAVHYYQETCQGFPAATLVNRRLPPEKRVSWLLAILPFVESNTIFSSTDLTRAWDAEENRKIVLISARIYLCPANANRRALTREALSHYVGVTGINPDAALLPRKHRRAGIFGYHSSSTVADYPVGIRPQDVKDDRSTTLMAIETNVANGPWLAGGPPTVRGLDPGESPYLGTSGQSGSFHRGGSEAVFADASVRFLSATMNPQVFEALATIAGGEPVDPDVFDD
jgi:hypothetical protein